MRMDRRWSNSDQESNNLRQDNSSWDAFRASNSLNCPKPSEGRYQQPWANSKKILEASTGGGIRYGSRPGRMSASRDTFFPFEEPESPKILGFFFIMARDDTAKSEAWRESGRTSEPTP